VVVAGGSENVWREQCGRLVRRAELPVLLLLREVPELEAPAAALDEGACMAQLTRHVLSLGHRRVAYVGIDPAHFEGQQRYWGFATTLWADGLELPLDWVFTQGEVDGEERERFRQAFGGAYRPTAVVCASDLLAAAALCRLNEMGLDCPGDVAVVGLGDREFASLLTPPLTTLRFALPRLGQAAALMLLDILAERAVSTTRVAGELVVRASCGAGAPPRR
jgi:DNA-binding LacI/PurR family transcriptional regulator